MAQRKKVEGKPLRLGIVGVGTMAQVVHIPILKKIEGVEIAGVTDLYEEKGVRFAQKSGIPWFSSDDQLFASGIDGVLILTANNSHMGLAVSALNNGIHVMVEKPLARNSEEALKMIAAAEKNDKHLLVLMNQRFRQDTRVVKNYVISGSLGELYRIRTGWMTKWDKWNRPEWVRDKKISGGGVLMDYGIQLIDMILWVLNYPKVVRVGAMIKKSPASGNVEDYAMATFYLEKGVAVTLEVSWALHANESDAWTVFAGTRGRAYMNPVRVNILENDKIKTTMPLKSLKAIDIHHASYESELRHFAEVLRGDANPGATAKECLQSLRLVEAIYEAAKAGHELSVDIGPMRG